MIYSIFLDRLYVYPSLSVNGTVNCCWDCHQAHQKGWVISAKSHDQSKNLTLFDWMMVCGHSWGGTVIPPSLEQTASLEQSLFSSYALL